jgi:hypothetical protein
MHSNGGFEAKSVSPERSTLAVTMSALLVIDAANRKEACQTSAARLRRVAEDDPGQPQYSAISCITPERSERFP